MTLTYTCNICGAVLTQGYSVVFSGPHKFKLCKSLLASDGSHICAGCAQQIADQVGALPQDPGAERVGNC